MIIRETKMVECWCGNCNKGQMAQLGLKELTYFVNG